MAKSSDQANSRYLEVERKFEVFESTVRPSFEGLSSVARVERSPSQQLDAVYFDTPAHDLAAHRVTLRRRTGGPDAGWHIKLPAGPDARTEVRAPLGAETGDTVPEELLDIVLAIVRDRPVGPVARISTTRAVDMLYAPDGTAVAEFCDDDVVAQAEGDEEPEQRWREWELELAEGADPSLLDRLTYRLLDAGAAVAGHGSKLARVLEGAESHEPDAVELEPPADPVHRAVAEQVEQLLVWDRAVRADTYDSVHQMRVTTRKIRSLLQASEDAFGISDDAWVLDELRQLAAVLGVARDAELDRRERRGARDDERAAGEAVDVAGRHQVGAVARETDDFGDDRRAVAAGDRVLVDLAHRADRDADACGLEDETGDADVTGDLGHHTVEISGASSAFMPTTLYPASTWCVSPVTPLARSLSR